MRVVASSTETWWIVGWSVAVAVVLVAALLLLAIIALARRVVRQAGDIVAALDGARLNTEPLFDLANVNYSLEQITRRLKPVPEAERESEGVLGRITRGLQGGGEQA